MKRQLNYCFTAPAAGEKAAESRRMIITTDKGTFEADSIEWYGCDLYLRTGNNVEIIQEPKYIQIEKKGQ